MLDNLVYSEVHKINIDIAELGILQYLEILVVQHLSLNITCYLLLILLVSAALNATPLFGNVPLLRVLRRTGVFAIIAPTEHGAAGQQLAHAHISVDASAERYVPIIVFPTAGIVFYSGASVHSA